MLFQRKREHEERRGAKGERKKGRDRDRDRKSWAGSALSVELNPNTKAGLDPRPLGL